MEEKGQNPSESIIIGNCLSCQGLVRVPSTAPAKSVVRCPHCSTSYPLSEILDQAVPELEFVHELQVESKTSANDIPRVDQVVIKTDKNIGDDQKFVVPPQLAKGARHSRRRSRSSGSDGSSDVRSTSDSIKLNFDNRSSQRSGRGSESSGRSRSQHGSSRSSRRYRKERSPAVEILKVIVGGILAIPIAYMIVIWFFRQDPLDVGPKLGNFAPFMVPSEFRGTKGAPKWAPNNPENNDEEDPESEIPEDLPVPDVDPDRIRLDNDDASTSPRYDSADRTDSA